RAAFRTSRPYGTDASFDAMRLARTEIARAANSAAYTAAVMNPYVTAIDIARSPNGSRDCKICPQYATIGFGGERIRDSYPIESAPIPVFHPQCMCHTRSVTTDKPADITARLRAVLEEGRLDLHNPAITPAQRNSFIEMLIGLELIGLLAGLLREEDQPQ